MAPVKLPDGTDAILKIGFPHDEARFESHALRFLNGDGVVRLLHASDDGFSLLLERCLPGTDLWSLDEEEGNAVACQIMTRLWRETDSSMPFLSLSDYVATWWEDLPNLAAGHEDELVAEVVALGRELAVSQSQSVFLHGDFHPGNVLAAQREPWLVIDPKPLVGEPAYDLAQWLFNRSRFVFQNEDPVGHLRQQVERFATELDLNASRIAGWAFVKAFGWQCGPETIALFQKVMRTL